MTPIDPTGRPTRPVPATFLAGPLPADGHTGHEHGAHRAAEEEGGAGTGSEPPDALPPAAAEPGGAGR
ncbi:hypothetical protein ACFU6K_20275, partial [Kitasatospora sp. NPDC057512]